MPILVSKEIKNNPEKRWALDDKTFFAAGACHILAYAFLEIFNEKNFKAIWIKPINSRGNHIIVSNEKVVFDYQGYANHHNYFENLKKDWSGLYPEWDFTLVYLPKDVLISEEKSKKYNGLWLREPNDFLFDALPRALNYLNTFNHSLLTTDY
jgi:hypothetical protein